MGLSLIFPLLLILTNFHFDNTVTDYKIAEYPQSIDFASDSNVTYSLEETPLVKSFYKNNHTQSNQNHGWLDAFTSVSKSIDGKNALKSVKFVSHKTIPDPPKKILDKYMSNLKRSEREWHPNYRDNKKYYSHPPSEAISLNPHQDVIDQQNITLSNPYNARGQDLNGTRATIIGTSYVSALGTRSLIAEPSIANHGNIVFMTGNWWAGRSSDGGKTFLYLDPFSDFSTFCCDQDVVYNKNHNVWVWYRQGIQDPLMGNRNIGRIGVSTDDASTWCFFDISAQSISSSLTSNWLDYPHMQITNDKLYLSTNVFAVSGGIVNGAMLRFDLENIKTCNPTYDVLLTDSFSLTPVNGATDTMYFGSVRDSGTSRIYKWLDSSSSVSYHDVTYTSSPVSGYSCTLTIEQTNPCGRSDTRMLGGYIANGILGFVWNAAQGGAFPYPFVNYIRINESTGSLIDNPLIYSTTYAVNYPSVAVNSNGDVGIAYFIMGVNQEPAYVVGIHDALTSGSSSDFALVKTSSNGPNVSNSWGDFIRVKAFDSNAGQWISSGYTLQGGSSGNNVEIFNLSFGRCLPPATGDWTVSQSCTLTASSTPPANVIVPSGVVLTIPNGLTLNVEFTHYHILVQSGGGILIQSGGLLK